MDTPAFLQAVIPISARQFAGFRIVFGLYLAAHFAQLAPYGKELFSREGALPRADLNLTHGILPNPLEHWDSPRVATGFLLGLTVLSLAFAAGILRSLVAMLLWYGSACLFNRNNLISNPAIPYLGMLLLLCAIVPKGEGYGLSRKSDNWFFPAWVYGTAWLLLFGGYTFSGLHKLLFSPSWRDGAALSHVLSLPLARPGWLRETIVNWPVPLLQIVTWLALGLEISALPLCLFPQTRFLIWSALAAMHVGILGVIAFADLSLGMLMVHFFAFNPQWLSHRPGPLVTQDNKLFA